MFVESHVARTSKYNMLLDHIAKMKSNVTHNMTMSVHSLITRLNFSMISSQYAGCEMWGCLFFILTYFDLQIDQ